MDDDDEERAGWLMVDDDDAAAGGMAAAAAADRDRDRGGDHSSATRSAGVHSSRSGNTLSRGSASGSSAGARQQQLGEGYHPAAPHALAEASSTTSATTSSRPSPPPATAGAPGVLGDSLQGERARLNPVYRMIRMRELHMQRSKASGGGGGSSMPTQVGGGPGGRQRQQAWATPLWPSPTQMQLQMPPTPSAAAAGVRSGGPSESHDHGKASMAGASADGVWAQQQQLLPDAALVSERSRMNPVYRKIRKKQLQLRLGVKQPQPCAAALAARGAPGAGHEAPAAHHDGHGAAAAEGAAADGASLALPMMMASAGARMNPVYR